MLAGVKDILIFPSPISTPKFQTLLGNVSKMVVNFSYKVQPSPDWLAQAFLLGEEFIGDYTACMIIYDNIFYWNGLKTAF